MSRRHLWPRPENVIGMAWLRRFRRRGDAVPVTREPAPDWRAIMRRRMLVLAGFATLWVAAIEGRLVYLQVVKHDDLVARAGRQQLRTPTVPAKRADIVDRHGRVLATSLDADTIYAVPSEIDDPVAAAKALCGALTCTSKERQALTERLDRRSPFTYVRRQVSPDEKGRVEALNLDGVGFSKESRRFYPNKELAAHLLGYVGTDNTGLAGVEAAYDSQIKGKDGRLLVQTDARRHAFSRIERPPTAGSTIELTIDEYLQHVVERELRAGVGQNRAAGGTAIVLDPRTGEILALANEPTFNPNVYREFHEDARRNRAVQDVYEPGSTFKIVTASAAIEEKVMPLESWIDTSPGRLKVSGRAKLIREASSHNYGVLSFTDVIVKSSNVGAVKIGFRVGTDRLSRYVERFGFGHRLSPDFPGESTGIVWDPSKWTESALASVSMGYQVAVTPLQMLSAIASIANNGEMVEPRVVRAIYRDGRRYAVDPKVLRRTVKPETAATLTTIMEDVVQRGTARSVRIPGYTIAGKTGTAAKLVDGHYSFTDYNASFVGFLPSRNPALAIVVVTDTPRAGPTTGGPVSGPVFKRIAEAALHYLGIAPTIAPDLPVLVAARTEASTPSVMHATNDPEVALVASDDSNAVPDVVGMSAREAMRTLARLGLVANLSGDGFVVSQDPPAGTALEGVAGCRLTLQRFAGLSPASVGPP